MGTWYAVRGSKINGVFASWEEAMQHMRGQPKAELKQFERRMGEGEVDRGMLSAKIWLRSLKVAVPVEGAGESKQTSNTGSESAVVQPPALPCVMPARHARPCVGLSPLLCSAFDHGMLRFSGLEAESDESDSTCTEEGGPADRPGSPSCEKHERVGSVMHQVRRALKVAAAGIRKPPRGSVGAQLGVRGAGQAGLGLGGERYQIRPSAASPQS